MIVATADTWRQVTSKSQTFRLIYRSSSGDEWLLTRDDDGDATVIHVPNAASGGEWRQITLAGFLVQPRRAEVSALLQMVASLVDGTPNSEETR